MNVTDIEHHSIVEFSAVAEIVRTLHSVGLVNMALFFERVNQAREELQREVDGFDDRCSESFTEGYDEGFSEGASENRGAGEFSNWYLREFEDKKTKVKNIRTSKGDVSFVIMLESDYEDLKSKYHEVLD